MGEDEDVLKGAMKTLSECLSHVRGTRIYFQGFRDFLSVAEGGGDAVGDNLKSLEGDCEKIGERIEELIKIIRDSQPQPQDIPLFKRTSERVKVHGTGFIRRSDRSEIMCFLKDLSLGGACVTASAKGGFERGEQAYLELRCDAHKDKICKDVEIVWLKPVDEKFVEVGVRFFD